MPSTRAIAGPRLCRGTCASSIALCRPPHIQGVAFARPGSQAKPGDRRNRLLGITLLDEAHPDQPGGRLELSVRPQFEGAHTGAPRGLTHVGDVNSLRHVKPAPWRAPSGDQPDGASFADLRLVFNVGFFELRDDLNTFRRVPHDGDLRDHRDPE